MATSFKTFVIITILVFATRTAIAQEKAFKIVEKSFPLSSLGELKLDNRYGNITVNGWDKNEVSVKVLVRITPGENRSSKELLQRINPVFNLGNNTVSVVSQIAKADKNWFTAIFNFGDGLDNSQIQIDYEVYATREANLNITNRFGNVVLNQWNGLLNCVIEHGDIRINTDLKKADISIEFGKLEAEEIHFANLNVKNGALEMGGSNTLKLNSRGTTVKIGTVNTLEVDSNKDNMELNEVSTIFGHSKFGSLKIERLTHSLNLDMKIMDLTIKRIIGVNTQLFIEQESCDIILGVTNFSHRFSATLEQGVVRLPKSFENINSNFLNKSKKLREIEGTYGTKNLGQIEIQGIKGIITLQE